MFSPLENKNKYAVKVTGRLVFETKKEVRKYQPIKTISFPKIPQIPAKRNLTYI